METRGTLAIFGRRCSREGGVVMRFFVGPRAAPPIDRRKIGVEESERVARLDRPHPFLHLLGGNVLVKLLHLGPVQLGPKMVFGVTRCTNA